MYKGNFEAWGKISRAEGLRGIFTGWGPTFFGYSVSLLYYLELRVVRVLTCYRPKVLSNMADTNSSRSFTPTLRDPILLPNIKPHFT